MRKFITALLALGLLLALVVPGFAQEQNIAEVASGISDFSTLVAAADAAGLVSTLANGGPFTVFAPTNGAFGTLLGELGVSAEELLANEALVRSVLLYHVIPGKIMAADIVGSDSLPLSVRTVNGASVNVNVVDGKVSLNNGRAIVILADVEASNGVIHVIDNVILPPAAAEAPAPAASAPAGDSIAAIAASISDFSTLVAAADAAGLVDTLANGGPFTVFAPTNGAFGTLLGELGVTAEQLLADEALVRAVLLYHVIPGEVFAADIVGAESLPLNVATANGARVNINVVDGKVSLNNGRAIVIQADVDASNGVIHVIDNVILPPQ